MNRMMMPIICLVLLLTFNPRVSNGSSGGIVHGNAIGEIYFTGPAVEGFGNLGLYKSDNFGQIISKLAVDTTTDFYGSLLADAYDSCLYRLRTGDYNSITLTRNDGWGWELISYQVNGNGAGYDAGCSEGEVYRIDTEYAHGLERSTNYGYTYQLCTALGFPDSSTIYSLALGSEPGEVYLLTQWNDFYYSNDSGETFGYLSNLWNLGAPNYSYLISGSQMDEMFLFHYDSQRIWRITEQGQNLELVADFDLYGWTVWVTAGKEAGRLYLRANSFNFGSFGGVIRIYTTDNYGSDWTMIEHLIDPNGVISDDPLLPTNQKLEVWPNPTNASLTVGFIVLKPAEVKIEIYNLSGNLVLSQQRSVDNGYQVEQLNLSHLASGTYFLRLAGQPIFQLTKFCLLK